MKETKILLSCPKCQRAAPLGALYCRACYSVLPTPVNNKDAPNAKGGRTWRRVGFVVLAGFIGWFYQLDVDPWGEPHNAFEASAASVKKQAISVWAKGENAARRAIGAETEEAASHPVRFAEEDVVRSAEGCAITRRVWNPGSETTRNVVVSFSFENGNGESIGSPVRAEVQDGIPAGGSRDLTFVVPCPGAFATVRAWPAEQGVALGDPALQQAVERVAQRGWVLENIPDLSCRPSEGCTATIEFASGDTGRYRLLPGDRSWGTLEPLNAVAEDLLEQQREGLLRVQGRDGQAEKILRQEKNIWAASTPSAKKEDRR